MSPKKQKEHIPPTLPCKTLHQTYGLVNLGSPHFRAVKKITQNAVKNCALFEVARHKPSPPSQKHLRATSSRSLGIRRDFSATNSPALNFWFFWFKPKEQTKTINQLQLCFKTNLQNKNQPTRFVLAFIMSPPSTLNFKLQTLNFFYVPYVPMWFIFFSRCSLSVTVLTYCPSFNFKL